MRVTNLMMTNNALFNLQKQEQRLNTLENQYSTQKKISSPSEDPIIAVRALKLNTTYSEVSQFVEKNIPDANAWMSMTQSALDNTTAVLTSIYEKCVQGNADDLSDTDRKAIATSLAEYRDQIYQEGTSSYGGRFLFTGFKTDVNLIFEDDCEDEYKITENFKDTDISTFSVIVDGCDDTDTTAGKVPTRVDMQRLRLAYDNTDFSVLPSVDVTAADGTVSTLSTTDQFETYNEFVEALELNPNLVGSNSVIYIADKGELVLGSDVTDTLKASEGYSVQYQKTGFKANELRPEHYFTCTRTTDKGVPGVEKTYEYEATNQEIKYLVNYNQQMTVNVQAKECFTHDMGRDVDELVDIVNDVIKIEELMNTYETKMKAASEGTADYVKFKGMFENAKVEFELRSKKMQEAFANAETAFQGYATKFSNQSTDVGTRQQRLALIKTRLENQQADVEELGSENIDVDLSEIIVRYTSAYDVYQAALSSTSKSITQTLLDYL